MTEDKIKAALLPCPFCGARAETFSRKNGVNSLCQNDVDWWVSCEGCGGQTCMYESEVLALRAWNNRSDAGRERLLKINHGWVRDALEYALDPMHDHESMARKCRYAIATLDEMLGDKREGEK